MCHSRRRTIVIRRSNRFGTIQYDRVFEGKYTVGLGQKQMGYCTDLEDVNSLCLAAVSQLIENNGISYSDIGRPEVGTETKIDKPKSAKAVLMKLFEASGNFLQVEGIDTTNAFLRWHGPRCSTPCRVPIRARRTADWPWWSRPTLQSTPRETLVRRATPALLRC